MFIQVILYDYYLHRLIKIKLKNNMSPDKHADTLSIAI